MRAWLIITTLFVAVTAIPCGIMLVGWPDGHLLQLPLTVLDHSPFSNFIIPGLVLLFAVGGTNALASIALLLRHRFAGMVAMAAGLCVIGWIAVQVLLTNVLFWLQPVYLAAGILILFCSLHLQQNAPGREAKNKIV